MVGELPVKLHKEKEKNIFPSSINSDLKWLTPDYHCSDAPCYLCDVHELRIQLRDDIFHWGMMGVLSDQGFLNLYLDTHQLGRGTRETEWWQCSFSQTDHVYFYHHTHTSIFSSSSWRNSPSEAWAEMQEELLADRMALAMYSKRCFREISVLNDQRMNNKVLFLIMSFKK